MEDIYDYRNLTEEESALSLGLIFNNEITEKLAEKNIYTLGELLKAKSYTLQIIQERNGFSSTSYFLRIRETIHKLGFLFEEEKDEYKTLKISEEMALTNIDNLEIDNSIKWILKNNGIDTLGVLLTYDYNNLLKIYKLTKHKVIILKKYVHSLGYSFKNEYMFLEEIIEEKRKKGVDLLENYIEGDQILCNSLYRNKIYTLEDLIVFGDEVFKLIGIGPSRRDIIKKLFDIAKEKAIGVEKLQSDIFPTEEDIASLSMANEEIKFRISKKEALLSIYNLLLQENKKLSEYELELDERIKTILDSFQSLLGDDKKNGKK